MADDAAALLKLEAALAAPSKVHRAEPEIRHPSQLASELQQRYATKRLTSTEPADCYAIMPEFARYLFAQLKPEMKTLETGAGVSTLVFALAGTWHTVVTPEAAEAAALQEYAAGQGIDLARVSFALAPSEIFLPSCELTGLDVVLLDGKHAFPWPVLDWFFIADRLARQGLLMVDDIQLTSVRMLTDFLDIDPRWAFEAKPGGRTAVYRKLADQVHDVAWYMQPWVHEIKLPLGLRLRVEALRCAARLLDLMPFGRSLKRKFRLRNAVKKPGS